MAVIGSFPIVGLLVGAASAAIAALAASDKAIESVGADIAAEAAPTMGDIAAEAAPTGGATGS
jgi:hypothetical protein